MEELNKKLMDAGLRAYIRSIVLNELVEVAKEHDAEHFLERLNSKLMDQFKVDAQKIFEELMAEIQVKIKEESPS